MDDKTRLQQGIKVRREVLGDAWVDKSNKAQSEFNADWFDFIQRTAWGDIWSRPGLDRKTRSINLSVKAKDMADESQAMKSLRTENAASAAGSTNLGALLRAKLDKSNPQE